MTDEAVKVFNKLGKEAKANVTKMIEFIDEEVRKDNKEIARYLETGLYSFEANGERVTIGRIDKLREYIRQQKLTETRIVVTIKPPSEVEVGEEFSFSGYLEDVEGNRIPSKIVRLIRNGTLISEAITGVMGEWSFSVSLVVPSEKPYDLSVEFPGNNEYRETKKNAENAEGKL